MLQIGVRTFQSFTQGVIQGVDRTVTFTGNHHAPRLGAQLHRGFGLGLAGIGTLIVTGLHHGAPGLYFEIRRQVTAARPHQQLERSIGGVEGVSPGFAFLYGVHYPTRQVRGPRQVNPHLFGFELHRGAPRHLGNQHPHVVTHQGGVDVLIEVGVHTDGGGVQAGLVRERRTADVRKSARGRQVRDLGHAV